MSANRLFRIGITTSIGLIILVGFTFSASNTEKKACSETTEQCCKKQPATDSEMLWEKLPLQLISVGALPD